MNSDALITNRKLTSPRAAAIAGIIFSVLLIISLTMIRISVPLDPREAGSWFARDWKVVKFALNLLPFAGIAFLWFIGVVRDRLGEYEDRLFATVFLGSGILFLAMLFSMAALAGGIINLFAATPGSLIDSLLYAYGRTVVYEIMNVYTMRMAGVFMITTSTLSMRTGIAPRWMAQLGLVLALILLLTVKSFAWTPLIFPLWVLMISLYILVENLRKSNSQPVPSAPQGGSV